MECNLTLLTLYYVCGYGCRRILKHKCSILRAFYSLFLHCVHHSLSNNTTLICDLFLEITEWMQHISLVLLILITFLSFYNMFNLESSDVFYFAVKDKWSSEMVRTLRQLVELAYIVLTSASAVLKLDNHDCL